ncbi:MAG: hypothetical protein V1489_00510 [Candidatus Liptonbacteria bacterium]
MLGKPEWFGPRKYTGWGATPRTWQGWVYVLVAVAPLALFGALPLSGSTKPILMGIWAAIFIVDFIDIILRMQRDERERLHEAIAERNALWVIIVVLAVGIAYQAAQSSVLGKPRIDPIILIAVIAGVIVKAVTNIYLDSRD